MKTNTIIAILGVSAQACTIPKANAASVDLVAEFEGWRPNVCTYT
jgi:hypothetical protein